MSELVKQLVKDIENLSKKYILLKITNFECFNNMFSTIDKISGNVEELKEYLIQHIINRYTEKDEMEMKELLYNYIKNGCKKIIFPHHRPDESEEGNTTFIMEDGKVESVFLLKYYRALIKYNCQTVIEINDYHRMRKGIHLIFEIYNRNRHEYTFVVREIVES